MKRYDYVEFHGPKHCLASYYVHILLYCYNILGQTLMNKVPVASKCRLCEINKAKLIMKNRVNGNDIKACEGCYKQIWDDRQ
jgi:hypothetical protein